MKKQLSLVAIVIIAVFVAIILSFQNSPSATFENGKTISLEVARTTGEKATGLMDRPRLAPDAGMIFVYEKEYPLSFWMKDTLIPLDIIFLNQDYEIVSIQTMQPCTGDPCQTYASETLSKYAIEVNAGFAEENNILVGQKVILKEL